MRLTGDCIVFTIDKENYSISIDDILYVFSKGNYSRIFTKDNESSFLLCKTLKYVELSLRKFDFYRVSRGILINQNHVLKIDSGTTSWVMMSNGERFPVAFRRRQEFLELYQEKQPVLNQSF